ncbi:MAG: TetR/AcrR family transcriptional regulator [Actinomycetota bacterium]
MSARPKKKESPTRERIVEAAIETLREEGFAGTTARSIAQRGDFNQALIFYHFGSVPALLLETFRKTSEEQIAKYRAAAAEVGSLHDLVEIARRLHVEDHQTGSVTAVTQLMAAAASDDEVGRAILDRFESWIGIVEEALRRGLAPHPMGSLVPVREAAYAISAMFLGIELMSRLDPERSEADRVFDMMALLAQLVEQLTPSLIGSETD